MNDVILLLINFCLGVVLFSSLYLVVKKRPGNIWKIFHIPARKSATDAIQFGGLPVALCLMCAPWVVREFHPLPLLLERLLPWMNISQALVIIYGYLDDRYEIRPIFKLIFQFIAVGIFSLVASAKVYPQFSSGAFILMFGIGVAIMNGSNLLDGLDTLTIKFSSVQFLALMILPALFPVAKAQVLILMAAMGLSTVWSFYPFNREPAKIHLGEIGGPSIGLYCYMLSTILFAQLEMDKSFPRLFLALTPLALPVVELGVSFLRRLYNKKGPFKGDQLHVHHILRQHHKYSPSKASSIIAGLYLVMMTIGISTAWFFKWHIIGPILEVVGIIGVYVMIGKKHWHGKDTIELSAKSLFNFIRKKDVMLIETSIIDNFEITIMNKEEIEQLKKDHQTTSGEKSLSDSPSSSSSSSSEDSRRKAS